MAFRHSFYCPVMLPAFRLHLREAYCQLDKVRFPIAVQFHASRYPTCPIELSLTNYTLNTILADLGVLTAQAGEDYYGIRFIIVFEPMVL